MNFFSLIAFNLWTINSRFECIERQNNEKWKILFILDNLNKAASSNEVFNAPFSSKTLKQVAILMNGNHGWRPMMKLLEIRNNTEENSTHNMRHFIVQQHEFKCHHFAWIIFDVRIKFTLMKL